MLTASASQTLGTCGMISKQVNTGVYRHFSTRRVRVRVSAAALQVQCGHIENKILISAILQ